MSAITTTKKKSFTTFQMTLIAVMAAITCILGPLSIPIPISPVPISLTNLAIYLTVCQDSLFSPVLVLVLQSF